VWVDGVRSESLRVGGYFRGVVVSAGAQRVRWRYSPAGWRLGLVLLCPGALLLVGIAWWERVGVRREPGRRF
jgi:uncharacterized membrane protein YfhO